MKNFLGLKLNFLAVTISVLMVCIPFNLKAVTYSSESFYTGKVETFGYISGEFSVDESGASAYNIPLQIPPGTAGMAPELNLSYNSLGGDGLLGKGWSLSGLTGVTRCGKNINTDGVSRQVNLTTDDRFCVDGQRLINISGAYGAAGTTYRTEMDSYTVYTSFGAQGNGPAYFTATTKSGLIMTYGHVESGYNSRIEATNSATVTSWQIGKVADTVGNYYLVNYIQDANGSTRPEKIDYTFLGVGGSNNNSVKFLYGNRPKNSSGYLAGSLLTKNKLINRIETYAAGILVKEYWFSYAHDEFTSIPIINKIQECSVTKCKPAVQLTNQSMPGLGGWDTNIWNWNGGISIYQIPSQQSAPPIVQNDDSGSRFIDINGDGRVDILWSVMGTDGVINSSTRINTGDGWVIDPNYALIYPIQRTVATNTHVDAGSRLIDINGDGLLDQIYGRFDGSVYIEGVAINTGTGFQEHAAYSDIAKVTDIYNDVAFDLVDDTRVGQDTGSRLIDVNGDGLVDIVKFGLYRPWPYTDNVPVAFLNTGNGWEKSLAYEPKFPIVDGSGKDTGSRFVDINNDGLIDQIYSRYTKDVTGVYHSEFGAAINTGTGWDINNDYTPSLENVNFVDENLSKPDNGRRLVDINGDGLIDIAYHWESNGFIALQANFINTGSEFVQESGSALAPFPTVDINGKNYGSQLIDINGDGLIDQVYSRRTLDSGSWAVTYGAALNTGTGWNTTNNYSRAMETNVLVDDGAGQDKDRGVRFIDINNDGLVDVLKNNNGDSSAWINTGTGWIEDVDGIYAPLYPIVDAGGKNYGSEFIDLNSDGYIDQFVARYDPPSSSVNGIAINKGKAQLLTNIVTPNGPAHTIHYKNTTDPNVYKVDDFPVADGAYAIQRRPNIIGGAVNPRWDSFVRDITPNINVVADYSVSNGVGGMSSTSYYYQGYKVHAKRGSLGFSMVSDQDLKTGFMTKSTYRQDYPYTGMLLNRKEGVNLTETRLSTVYCDNSSTSSKASTNGGTTTTEKSTTNCVIAKDPAFTTGTELVFNTLENLRFKTGITVGKAIAPHVTQSVEQQNNLSTGDFLKSITTENTYDNAGNATLVTVTTKHPYLGLNVKTTNNIYDISNLLLGRLISTTVTSKERGVTATRVSVFEYDGITGLITKEIIEPYDHIDSTGDIALTNITTYEYDVFGNKETATISSAITDTSHIAYFAPRKSKTVYDSQGLFINYVENAYGQKDLKIYEASFGNLIEQTGPNLITTRWQYDDFGSKINEVRADGTNTIISEDWCQTSCSVPALSPSNIPQIAQYVVTTEQVKNGVAYSSPLSVYYDELGREIRRSTIGFAGEVIYKDTNYDDWGQLTAVSSLYSDIAEANSTFNEYDVYGRIIKTTSPDSGVNEITYNGYYTYYTNSNNYSTKRRDHTNALGYLWESFDSKGRSVVNKYDPFGNKISILLHAYEHVDLTENIETKISYDVLGRKIGMDDPDTGIWSYVYNAAGDLVSQTDAKLQTTHFTYDLLGRLITREELNTDGTIDTQSSWVYQNARVYESDLRIQLAYCGVQNAKCIGKLTSETDSSGLTKNYIYNELGLLSEVDTVISGETFTQTTAYDLFNRIESITYPESTGGLSGRFQVKYHYNAYAYLYKVSSMDNSIAYWQATAMDVRGMVSSATYGNGVESWNAFNAAGRIIWQDYANTIGDTLYHAEYKYDSMGNLLTRSNNRRTTSGSQVTQNEAFKYDDLDRLIGTDNGSGAGMQYVYAYNGFGNIKEKLGVTGAYTYEAARPHAVKTANGNTYNYDANGNMVDGDSRTMIWNVNNKPTVITQGGTSINLSYAADRARFYQFATDGTNWKKTDYIGGQFERITDSDGVIEYKHFIRAAGQTIAIHSRKSDATSDTQYLLRDYQGSVVSIINNDATVKAQLDFFAFGSRREVVGSLLSDITAMFGRGYTGHEHLDSVGLIHMNGRVYDPVLGRFLSADPNVQAPNNLQNLNRYSYVMNNPMTLIDPSGFIHKKLTKSLLRFGKKYGRTIAAIVIASVVPGAQGFIGGFLSGLVSSGGDLKSAFIGGFSAVAFVGLNSDVFSVSRLLGNGLTGGIVSAAGGGRFKDGFLGSAVSFGLGFVLPIRNVFTAAIIGGTASVIGGGKFKNGAATAAFAYAVSVRNQAGRKPTEEEVTFARLSNDVYDPQGVEIDGFNQVGKLYTDRETGFQAALYVNGEGNSVLAFAGTNGANDWGSNVLQALGLVGAQYDQALVLARTVYIDTGANIRFVGHSLGGGLAAAAAIVTGGRATTFNAAGVHPNTVGGLISTPGSITQFSSSFDVMQIGNALTPGASARGTQVSLGAAGLHGMSGVCSAIGC